MQGYFFFNKYFLQFSIRYVRYIFIKLFLRDKNFWLRSKYNINLGDKNRSIKKKLTTKNQIQNPTQREEKRGEREIPECKRQ